MAETSLEESLRRLGLDPRDADDLSPSAVRAAYLRRALATHPDKCASPDAADRFRGLKAAHDAAQKALAGREAGAGARSADELDVLLAALRGLDPNEVERRLRGLGVHRPPEAFGFDLTVRFTDEAPRGGGRGRTADGTPGARGGVDGPECSGPPTDVDAEARGGSSGSPASSLPSPRSPSALRAEVSSLLDELANELGKAAGEGREEGEGW